MGMGLRQRSKSLSVAPPPTCHSAHLPPLPHDTTQQGSDVARLKAAGVPVRCDRTPAHMHHKFAVIDGRFLVTGSLNWTRAGVLENCENVLVLDAPAVAGRYTAQFNALWAAFA